MPFTASHVAAVLPFVRTPLVPSALVVGSMAPDQRVLFHVGFYGTHTPTGALGVDALVGFALLGIWHLLLAQPLYALSPAPLRSRLPVPDPAALLQGGHSTRRAVLTYASLVIGAATHIGLDEWTHPNRWGAEHIDWLAARHGPALGTTWTQLGSSVLGLALIAAWLVRWWQRTPPRPTAHAISASDASNWAVLLLPGLTGVLTAGVVGSSMLGDGLDPRQTVVWTVASGTATSLAVVVVLALAWQLRRVFGSTPNRHA